MEANERQRGLNEDSAGWVSGYAVMTLLIRRRRFIVVLAAIGAAAALSFTMLQTRLYRSTALFQPQSAEAEPSGLVRVASQFGFGVEASGGQWGPAVYVKLLKTRNVLEPVVLDSVPSPLTDKGNISVLDLLTTDSAAPESIEIAIDRLRDLFQAGEIMEIGTVELVVKSPWPNVSYRLTELLIESLNAYNVSRRRSHAIQEREFVETQVVQARAGLLKAEERLLTFVKQNRTTNESPELTYQRERLARDVTLRQTIYTSLVNDLAEVRIREVRDTPVITLLENPRLPLQPIPRNAPLKSTLGLLIGGLVAVFLVLARGVWQNAERSATGDAAEFFSELHQLDPRRWFC